jgi:uncharacterized BrkB/YihY/UPF0761 family membrane protein
MFWLWFFVFILIVSVGAYIVGTLDWHDDERIGIAWAIGIGALFWPLALAILILFGPFVGLFLLGDRRRRRKEDSSKNK